jgi:predicted nucleic acid-binding Zn ribbon protein
MNPIDEVQWGHDWAWGVPLIALTCVIHILCLAVFTARVDRLLDTMRDRGRHFTLIFSLVMAMAVTLVTVLHILEGGIWALAFRYLGAIPDNRSAMLYSLGALTTYGDTTIHLAHQWKMLGALEAVNGMLLFGLTTAFLFAMIQRVLPPANR